MPEKIYTIVKEGKPVGPFDLQELLSQGILPDSFVRKPEMDDYKEAHELPELRAFLGFEKQYTAPQYFASFDLRLLASAIDWFLITLFIILLEFIASFLFLKQTEVLSLLIANLLVIPICKLIYHIISETLWQATLGKKALNIKVTDLNGLKPKFRQIIGRNFAKILSTLPFFMGYLYSFLNKKQQCFHDKISHTLVVKERLI